MLNILKKYSLFAGGSALGAVVDYIVTLAAVRLFAIPPELALGLAMLISATAVFFWHGHVTFRVANQPQKFRRYLMFMAWSGVVFAMRAGLLVAFRTMGMPLTVALALAIVIASVINYLLSARVIFRQRQD